MYHCSVGPSKSPAFPSQLVWVRSLFNLWFTNTTASIPFHRERGWIQERHFQVNAKPVIFRKTGARGPWKSIHRQACLCFSSHYIWRPALTFVPCLCTILVNQACMSALVLLPRKTLTLSTSLSIIIIWESLPKIAIEPSHSQLEVISSSQHKTTLHVLQAETFAKVLKTKTSFIYQWRWPFPNFEKFFFFAYQLKRQIWIKHFLHLCGHLVCIWISRLITQLYRSRNIYAEADSNKGSRGSRKLFLSMLRAWQWKGVVIADTACWEKLQFFFLLRAIFVKSVVFAKLVTSFKCNLTPPVAFVLKTVSWRKTWRCW